MNWKLFYGDGSTFSDVDGRPQDAPAWNLQAIAQIADIAIGRKTVSHKDYYWFDPMEQEWFGGDYIGLVDFLQRSGLVKFGRAINRLRFEAILDRAVNDPDLLPKHAWDAYERD